MDPESHRGLSPGVPVNASGQTFPASCDPESGTLLEIPVIQMQGKELRISETSGISTKDLYETAMASDSDNEEEGCPSADLP